MIGFMGSTGVDMERDPSVPAVSCVIVAFHRPDALARLLRMLRHPDVELVVVNAEEDPEIAAVAGADAVPMAGNPGFATAVNAGARAATAPLVVFMNDDLQMSASDVLRLVEPVARGDADVALPCILDHRGHREPTIAGLLTPATLVKEWLLLPVHPTALTGWMGRVEKWRAPERPERIDAGSATVVATTADLLRAVPLPEHYFLYCEESEWFWHLRRRGCRVLYDPRAQAQHKGGRDDVRPAKSRLLARNAVRCVRQTQGRGKAALAWPVVVTWSVRLVVVDLVRSRLRGSAAATARLPARVEGLRAAVGAWREIVSYGGT